MDILSFFSYNWNDIYGSDKNEGWTMEVVLRNLTKKFPGRDRKKREDVIAVNDFDFVIPDGKLIGLLGPSGCGKSTTLNLISLRKGKSFSETMT